MPEGLEMGELLAGLNTVFNAGCAILLITGLVAIRGGHIERHKQLMIAAFVCSVLFLISYLCRFALTGGYHYPGDGVDRTIYLVILASHVLLAALVPWMAIRTLISGCQDASREAPQVGAHYLADLDLRLGHRDYRLLDALPLCRRLNPRRPGS